MGSGNASAGIVAGFNNNGSTATASPNVFGDVIVNNSANITAAAGRGIVAYNNGIGNVTITNTPV